MNVLTPISNIQAAQRVCAHCGLPSGDERFCCAGCEAAYGVIAGLGLGAFYAKRVRDVAARALRPERFLAESLADFARHVVVLRNRAAEITMAVDGLSCGACVWLIEQMLQTRPEVQSARVNLTTRRLKIVYQGDAEHANGLALCVAQLGYRVAPYDAQNLAAGDDARGRELTRCLAIAGFASANVMLLSLGVWFGESQNMGPATRGLLHWISALIALPAVAYAGQPFFRSAWQALRHGRSNMDVPISIGVSMVCAMSLVETWRGGVHAYFDSAVTLLFFLLIGRMLDHRARGAARATAAQLLMLRVKDVAVLGADGAITRMAPERVQLGDRVQVCMGERVGADGVILDGATQLDKSFVNGESLPVAAGAGDVVFAGMVNLGDTIVLRVSAIGDATLLAECQRLIDAATVARGRFVTISERVARAYAPCVHLAALGTFLLWYSGLHADGFASLRNAVSVLIVTCPCALALAVPAVQVITTSRLLRKGVLLKSPTALERLAEIDAVVFDKTGTLTEPSLQLAGGMDAAVVRRAAMLAAASRHPLCKALVREAGSVPPARGMEVREVAGQGVSAVGADGEMRLGNARFCGVEAGAGDGPELWFVTPGEAAVRFGFAEVLRPGMADVVRELARRVPVTLVSGDQAGSVVRIAGMVGISDFRAQCSPVAKLTYLQGLAQAGKHVLMVGDGVNDSPCLAAAYVSVAPSSGADIAQTIADVVIEGDSLAPLTLLLASATRARRAVGQNLAMSLLYNVIMVPLAVAGMVTPWIAALAMSGSSLLVMGNSFRGVWRR